MERSVTARYPIRPAARFVAAGGRARERRLGLRSAASFRAAPTLPTILRRADPGPYVALRARSRAALPAKRRASVSGVPRPVVSIHWADARGRATVRPPSAAPAPWRG
jgi:hypothetical protein